MVVEEDGDWLRQVGCLLEQALAYTAAPCKGACGPALKMPTIRALGMPMVGDGNAPPAGAAGRCGR